MIFPAITISQPSFTKSVGGYSSYVAYSVDQSAIYRDFEVELHLSLASVDQIALLFFLGQEGIHDLGADYLALSLVKGHILLTWDLGSGKRERA